MGATSSGDFLGIYLNDHLAAASGGVELARRAVSGRRACDERELLSGLADEVAADLRALLTIMRTLEIPVRRYKMLAGWAAEKAGRLKLNGRLLGRSPLSDLVELEGLLLAVEGKAAGWRTLLTIAEREPKLDANQLQELRKRAEAQSALLERLRLSTAGKLFRQAQPAGAGALPRAT